MSAEVVTVVESTGEIVDRRQVISTPSAPMTALDIANQCRSVEVWAESCTSVEELREADHRLAAIAEYVKRTSVEGRAKVEAARRRLEVRIGQLLGPAKVGANQYDEGSRASEASDLTANERSQMRKMADHPDVVDAVIDDSDDESPASRRRVLDEINRAKQAPAAEQACGDCMTRGGGHRDNCPTHTKQRRSPLPDAAAKAGWELRKAVERIERIVADDRFTANKEQVATQLRSHLTYVEEALPGLLDSVTTQQEAGQ